METELKLNKESRKEVAQIKKKKSILFLPQNYFLPQNNLLLS